MRRAVHARVWPHGGHIFEASYGGGLKGICGFCGSELDGDRCSTTATNLANSKPPKFESNCPMFPGSSMRYTNAARSTRASPCTNVPVLCTEGSCATRGIQFWLYNIATHYKTAHTGLRVTGQIEQAMAMLCKQSETESSDVAASAAAIARTIPDEHKSARDALLRIAAEHKQVVELASKQIKTATVNSAKRARMDAAVAASRGASGASPTSLYCR